MDSIYLNMSDLGFWNVSEYLDNGETMNSTDYVHVNHTGEGKFHATLKLYEIFIPSIGALSIVLNLAVVISSGLILKKGQQPRTTYLFLGNVAMTDLITALSIVFGQMYPNKYREHYICSLQLGMIVSSTLASVFSVGLIAIDRYLYILHGLQYQKWVYPTRARICIGMSWVIGCIIGYLPIMGWHGDTKNGKQCWFILLAPKNLIVLTVAMGSIPLITVMILYTIILYHAIRNIIRLQRARTAEAENRPVAAENGLRIFRGKSTDSSEQEEQTDKPKVEQKGIFKKIFMKNPSSKVKAPNKWKAIKVVMFTSGSFVLTWGPYFITSLIYVYSKDEKFVKKLSFLIASPLAILGFCNTLINPIIYAWWHKGFRSFIKKKFDSIRHKNGSMVSSPSSKNTSSTSPGRKSSTSSGMGSVKGEVVKIEPIGNINIEQDASVK